jgi:hypothetical protein
MQVSLRSHPYWKSVLFTFLTRQIAGAVVAAVLPLAHDREAFQLRVEPVAAWQAQE